MTNYQLNSLLRAFYSVYWDSDSIPLCQIHWVSLWEPQSTPTSKLFRRKDGGNSRRIGSHRIPTIKSRTYKNPAPTMSTKYRSARLTDVGVFRDHWVLGDHRVFRILFEVSNLVAFWFYYNKWIRRRKIPQIGTQCEHCFIVLPQYLFIRILFLVK